MPCGRASDQIEIFFHISTGNTYTIPIHSLLFLYYVESPKVPPRVFGPLGPKTLRGQLNIVTRNVTLAFQHMEVLCCKGFL